MEFWPTVSEWFVFIIGILDGILITVFYLAYCSERGTRP